MNKNFIPVVNIADGNCQPHALANVLLSDEGRSDKVRVCITLATVLYEDNFVM